MEGIPIRSSCIFINKGRKLITFSLFVLLVRRSHFMNNINGLHIPAFVSLGCFVLLMAMILVFTSLVSMMLAIAIKEDKQNSGELRD